MFFFIRNSILDFKTPPFHCHPATATATVPLPLCHCHPATVTATTATVTPSHYCHPATMPQPLPPQPQPQPLPQPLPQPQPQPQPLPPTATRPAGPSRRPVGSPRTDASSRVSGMRLRGASGSGWAAVFDTIRKRRSRRFEWWKNQCQNINIERVVTS
jgi:hypothetical protein